MMNGCETCLLRIGNADCVALRVRINHYCFARCESKEELISRYDAMIAYSNWYTIGKLREERNGILLREGHRKALERKGK